MGLGLRAVTLLMVATALGATAAPAQDEGIGEVYLARLVQVWHGNASRSDVEALAALLVEEAVYEHPRIGARIEGRAAIVEAMSSFVGATRTPVVSRVEYITGPGVVAVGFDLAMEQRQERGWSPLERRQLVVLETRDGRIVRISDHW